MRGMIDRDYNHPAVFSWVLFNETWGLTTKVGEREQLPARDAAQGRAACTASRSRSTRRGSSRTTRSAAAAATRETDLNSWHEYLARLGVGDARSTTLERQHLRRLDVELRAAASGRRASR